MVLMQELEHFVHLLENKRRDSSLISALVKADEEKKSVRSIKDIEKVMAKGAFTKLMKNFAL